MLISIPPKHAVAQVVGFSMGRSAFHIARVFGGTRKKPTGQRFWTRGTTYRRWVAMRRPLASTSGAKRTKIGGWINCRCSESATRGWPPSASRTRRFEQTPLASGPTRTTALSG